MVHTKKGKGMFSIGQFAKMGQVSLKLLRFYDRLGLLKPVHIHPETGYRYYSLDQLARLNRILALKNLGLTLREIQQLLDDNPSLDELRGMLKLQQAQLRSQIEREQQRLRDVETRLYLLELADPLNKYDIAVKQIPALHVASLRRMLTSGDEIAPLFGELQTRLQAKKIQAGAAIGVFHYENIPDEPDKSPATFYLTTGRAVYCHQFPGGDISDLEAACVVDESVAQIESIQIHDLPSVETMASLVYHGAFNHRHYVYIAFSHWANTSGYRVQGSVREVYLRYNGHPNHPENLLEVQFPVEKTSNE